MNYQMSKSIIILAAGASSRMKSSLKKSKSKDFDASSIESLNKSLIKIGKSDRPFLDHLLFNIEKAGYKNVFLVVGENSDEFKEFYGENKVNNIYRNLKISYATQYIPKDREKPMGTADAVLQVLEQYPKLLNECFTVCNSDNLYSTKALKSLRESEFTNAFIAYDRDGLDYPNDRISKFALIELDEDNNLLDIIEKPEASKVQHIKNNKGVIFVSMNLWKLKGNEIFYYLRSCPINPERHEKELPSAILNMVNESKIHINAIPFKQHVPDLTSAADISILQKYFSNYSKKRTPE